MPLEIHKFGGTSLKDSQRIQHVADLVLSLDKKLGVVLSAMGGVTDDLVQLVENAVSDKSSGTNDKIIANLILRHEQTLADLSGDKVQRDEILSRIKNDIKDIENILQTVHISKHYSESNLEIVSGYGELWSTLLLQAHMQDRGVSSLRIDSRQVLVVEHTATGTHVDWQQSQKKLQALLKDKKDSLFIITGYIASDKRGVQTTLKRNGSDYSAAIFAALLKADKISIWTDVDGVLSADPREVPEAEVLPSLSYLEALELAYFGAKVLHPKTMIPAMENNIPIWIRNTQKPQQPGTCLSHHGDRSQQGPVKALASISNISLINLEGAGMIGVPGISEKLFGSLKQAGISVIMISQASSEQSICIAVQEAEGDLAVQAISEAFAFELQQKQIQRVHLVPNCCIVAAVGDKMAETAGVSSRFFAAMARARINIRMIAQGSSERNISVVIDRKNLSRALRVVHSSFYLSLQSLSVGLIGPGLIGGTFLSQLDKQRKILQEEHGLDIQVRAVANSKHMLLSDSIVGFEKAHLQAEEKQQLDFSLLADHVQTDSLPHAVLIDCTASEHLAKQYPNWLGRGIHIITPNKKAGSGDMELYENIQKSLGTDKSRERARLQHTVFL